MFLTILFYWNPQIPLPTTMPEPDIPFISYYFAEDAHYHIFRNFSDLFESNENIFDCKIYNKNTNLFIECLFLYNPLKPFKPSNDFGFFSENIEADMWICFKDQNNNKKCIPIGFHIYKPIIYHPVLRDNSFNFVPGYYTLKGYNNITTKIKIICQPGIKKTNINTSILYDNLKNLYEFEFNTFFACPDWGTNPKFPQKALPTPTPSFNISENNFQFFEQNEDEFIQYQFNQFDEIISPMNLSLTGTFHNIYLFFNSTKLSTCPPTFNCKSPSNIIFEEASIWKCWITYFGEKNCFPIADYRYGFELRATRMIINGGYNGYYVDIILECDPRISNNTILFSKLNSESSSKVITLYGKTSSVCKQTIIPLIKNKEISFSGIFIIFFWIFITLLIGINGLIYYITDGKKFNHYFNFYRIFFNNIKIGWKIISFKTVENKFNYLQT